MANYHQVLATVAVLFCVVNAVDDLELDPNGYVLYCPCMGRFGNQADHFLGAFSFAQGLNRTLVLPPWVEYKPGKSASVQVPFDTYFQVEPLRAYHRVITMERFMKHLAPSVWPVGKRTSYCYAARRGSSDQTCNAKEGNPFGSFWNTFNIDFDDSAFYGPLHYDTHDERNRRAWLEQYPVTSHYILAFSGAPGAFPVREKDLHIQAHLRWSKDITSKVDSFYRTTLTEGPTLGLHFRNGVDWERACEHVQPGQNRNMFASAQCLGFRLERGDLTKELCFPSDEIVLRQIKKTVKKTGAKSIFVATDARSMKGEIEKLLKNKVKVYTYQPSHPHIDLAILGRTDFHIGNCVSTFSAFATRERRVNDKPVSFWGFSPKKHDEL